MKPEPNNRNKQHFLLNTDKNKIIILILNL